MKLGSLGSGNSTLGLFSRWLSGSPLPRNLGQLKLKLTAWAELGFETGADTLISESVAQWISSGSG